MDSEHPYHVDAFGGRQGGGLPQPPWFSQAKKKGKGPHGGGKRRRISFKGRRQPDFGQKQKDW